MFRIVALLFVLLVPGAVAGGTDPRALEELRQRIAPLTSLTAAFRQTVYSTEDYPIQESEGQLSIARPGRLRWISNAPFEQWVVADGETLWIYDPDLEQVTIRPFMRDIRHTPAILFIGEVDNLENDFRVEAEEGEEGTVYTLIPVGDQQLYRQLQLVFSGDAPVAMNLWDTLGQRTEISLSEVKTNVTVDPKQFVFIPPEGVDILRDD